MHAEIIWDGDKLNVPERMGKPNNNQLTGSNLDNLVELAGRTCYQSLGSKNSRGSEDYHKHIIEVGHLSVQEHANITFLIKEKNIALLESFLNRPGIYVLLKPQLRITINLRAIREWFKYHVINEMTKFLGQKLQYLTKIKSPLTMHGIEGKNNDLNACIINPVEDEEIWISFFIADISRSCTHELVRHGDFTSISQKSSRFCTESETPWIWHPYLIEFFNKEKNLEKQFNEEVEKCRNLYNEVMQKLQLDLNDKMDKLTARKQARGAARGILGNALGTELIFSANLKQWKHMILLRTSEGADAEIRVLFNKIFNILSQKYPEKFKTWTTKPCLDLLSFEANVT